MVMDQVTGHRHRPEIGRDPFGHGETEAYSEDWSFKDHGRLQARLYPNLGVAFFKRKRIQAVLIREEAILIRRLTLSLNLWSICPSIEECDRAIQVPKRDAAISGGDGDTSGDGCRSDQDVFSTRTSRKSTRGQ